MNLIKITNKPREVLELDLIIGGSRQNEKGEFPFCKTEKGKQLWEQTAFE